VLGVRQTYALREADRERDISVIYRQKWGDNQKEEEVVQIKILYREGNLFSNIPTNENIYICHYSRAAFWL
jgi:hypothetical protein